MAKVLLNAFYLQGQGKLQNAPGYIRAGIEDGYELLPQVATRWKVDVGSWKSNSVCFKPKSRIISKQLENLRKTQPSRI